MKKIIVFLLLLFLTAGVSFGQFDFGLKLGYNANKLSTNIDTITSQFNSGFHVGAFVRFGKRFYVQPEAYYTFQGAVFENNVSNTVNNWKQKLTIGTIDVPVLVGFKIINAKINWRILAGPMVSFVVNSKIENVSLTGPIKSSDINTVNWYIQAGTGVDVFFLTFDVRYQVGLNNMIETVSMGAYNYDLNTSNNMWVVTLGFKIL